jgi:tetratricopeptide (TPR) repeat protein
MNKVFFLVMVWVGFYTTIPSYGQKDQPIDVEQSAEVFLEEYSDAFQENFFEGLKQKGIQNYDRAITFFMECKRLQPENRVVAFELAKSHLLYKQLQLAQEYAIEALNGSPENYWYAEILSEILEAKKSILDEVTQELPWNNPDLRRNMAEIYFKKGDYQSAKTILRGLKEKSKHDFLEKRIMDSIAKQESKKQPPVIPASTAPNESVSEVENYKARIKQLLEDETDVQMVLQTSEEAMESFPTQPYFYYANGYALNRLQKNEEAIEVLETALDYLFDNISLENNIYKELVDAHNAIGNPSKANMYLSKIKPGF